MSGKDLLRVTKILAVKLFGAYTHEIPLRVKDHVTIIHGPNGVGKTVLFRLVTALLSGNVFELLKDPSSLLDKSILMPDPKSVCIHSIAMETVIDT